jgi:hypothetical protein
MDNICDSSHCMDHNAVIWTCFEQLLLHLHYHLCVFVLHCTYHDAESNVISLQDIIKKPVKTEYNTAYVK